MSASDRTVTALGHGRFLVDAGGRRTLAYGVTGPDADWVFVDGEVARFDRAATLPGGGRSGGSHTPDEDALSSPMPATVRAVLCAPGQQVARGDILVRLEAMKMELQISAPRDGTIAAVQCRPDDLVQPGVPLVTYA